MRIKEATVKIELTPYEAKALASELRALGKAVEGPDPGLWYGTRAEALLEALESSS